MVVRDGLARRWRGQRVRRAGHVLPAPTACRRGQSERLCAAATPLRACRARRSPAKPAPPRPARGARRLRARRSKRGHDAHRHRRLVAVACRRCVSSENCRARLCARPCVRVGAGGAGERRRRLLAQRSVAATVEFLLQPAAVGGDGIDLDRGQGRRGQRARMARSRMVERRDGAGCCGLGLGGHQFRRRRRADGISHARPRGRHALGRRHATRCGRHCARFRVPATCGSSRGVRGARRARVSNTRSR